MILSNKLDLTHNGGKNIHLNTFDQDYFDGADNTSSVGKVTDFNLMMRKGKCNGKVTHKLIKEKTEYILEKDYDTVIILAVDGELEIEGTKLIKLSKFDSLIVKKKDIGTKVSLSSITGTNVVITKIKY